MRLFILDKWKCVIPFTALCCLCSFLQMNHAQNTADMSDNLKKFAEIYGFATKMMNLGGSIIDGNNNGNGQTVSNFGIDSSRSSSSGSSALNGIFGEVMKQQSGSYNNKPIRSLFGTSEPSDYNNKMSGLPALTGAGGSTYFGEYGGGPLGATGSRSKKKSILDQLMGTFLGSSVDSEPSTSSYNPYSPYSSSFGGEGKSGSNINAIVQALTQSGVKRAESAEPDSATSFLSQFFGGRRK